MRRTVNFWDDAGRMPRDYLVRRGGGRYEAIVADRFGDDLRERSLGCYTTYEGAHFAIGAYRLRLMQAESFERARVGCGTWLWGLETKH